MSLIQVRLPVGTIVQLTAEQVFEMQHELAKGAPAPLANSKQPAPEAPKPAPEAPKPAPEAPKPAPAAEPQAGVTVETAKKADVIAWAATQGRDVQRVTRKLVEAYVAAMNAQAKEPADEEPEADEDVDELAVDTPDEDESGDDESDDDDPEDIFADDDEDDEDEDDDQPTYEDLHNAVRAAVKTRGKVEVRNIVKKYSPDNTLRGVAEASYGKLIAELA